MSYRNIRPSHTAESNQPTSDPITLRQSTIESVGSDPVRGNISPDKEIGASSSTSKRRRVPESVTRNACLNCKKARAKCDGKKPCTRCQTRVDSSNCIYEIHIKHAKEELVRQIKELKANRNLSDQIFQALSSNEQVSEILSRLQRGDSNESIVNYLGQSQAMEIEDTTSPRGSLKSQFDLSDQEVRRISDDLSARRRWYWSTVTDDLSIFQHLFQLYFAWSHPVYTLFSENQFVESYNAHSELHCSSALVNAICALACHFHTTRDFDEVNFEQLGHRFSSAARSSLDKSRHQSIASAQAFAVLSLVDLADGRNLRAATYLEIANKTALRLARKEEGMIPDAILHTLRGLRNLSVEWGLMTSRVVPYVRLSVTDPRDEIEYRLDETPWYHYRLPDDECPSSPCLLSTTNRAKAKLINIIAEINEMHYSTVSQTINARSILSLYRDLMQWRTDLPPILGNLEDNQARTLPHVLSLLILHSAAVIHLLRPLIDVPESVDIQMPYMRNVIWRHAQEGLSLVNGHYQRQYTTRCQPVFQAFSTLHFCDVIVRFFPNVTAGGETPCKSGDDALRIGFETLMNFRRGFPIAGPLQELLKRTAIECGVQLPHDFERLTAPPRPPYDAYALNDLVEACAGMSYLQPITEIQSRYAPSMAQDINLEANRYGLPAPLSAGKTASPEEERGAQSLMQIRNLLNSG